MPEGQVMGLYYQLQGSRYKKVEFFAQAAPFPERAPWGRVLGSHGGFAADGTSWPCCALVHRGVRFGAACAVLFLLAGCSTPGTPPLPPRENPPSALHAGEVIETATGRQIDMERLAEKLSKISVVYVGETHTSVEDHRVQLEILKKLSQGGRCVQLAMEMFPANAQPVLDRYIAGGMSERDFLSEVKWNEIWGFPYSLYKGLIDWQRQRRMPIIGLNAPRPVVKKIARGGLGSLTPAERSQVARVFHLDDPANRQRIEKEFKAHGKFKIKDFESFFEAQLAWEETMAQTLAGRLGETDCITVVVLGKGHVNKHHGVPHLTLLRRPGLTYATVVPVPVDYPPGAIGPDLADYVVITGRSEPLDHPRLGVIIEPEATGPGVRILAVLPGTPADAAHLQKADIVLTVNDAPVNSARELQRALAEAGKTCKLLIERGKVQLTLVVTISANSH